MKKTNLLFIVLLLAVPFSSFSQDWVKMMMDKKASFFETQKAFYEYEKNYRQSAMKNGTPADQVKVPGYKQFKRWEWFMAPRVDETGERFPADAAWKAMEEYRSQYSYTNGGNWQLLGPNKVTNLYGAGRLNFVRIHPNDPNTIFVGSPSGGLWKSTDGGSTWTTNTDLLSEVIGCTDIAIDPTNPSVMYLATGDGDAGDTYSVGLLKSTDGAATWQPTGLSFNMAQTIMLSKVLINPNATNIITVVTSGGIYRSTDAGATFTMVQSGGFKDMEFNPANPNTMYACGTEFYKSTDGGATWKKTGTNLPTPDNVSRMAIAVTPDDTTYIYLIAGLPGPNYGTQGFYKSTNGGGLFNLMGVPNIGTQQWYDLAIAVSPVNKEEVLLGGQTQFLKSTNGGQNWSNSGSGTHVDYHDIIYTSGTTCYLTSDGGIWRSNNAGGGWTNLSNGLAIAQMYGFGQSTTNANLHLQGWQDNGTARYNGSWAGVMGGDGMLCFISHSNDQNMWGSQYNGSLNKSINGGANWSACKGNITGTGAWVTPWREDPVTPNTIYAGFNDVWKHTGGGGTTGWTKISSFTGGASLVQLAVSPADNKVIWATGGGKLYKTANGGTNWTTITNVPAGTITYIACSNSDPKKAWITYSGFNSKNKVFQTNDQGVTWINLSNSLPNIPVNCITHVKNSNDAVYIGTDVGVFYRDATLPVWQPFSSGLPNVMVTQIEIFYPGNKLRASTYGRGIWESDFYVPGTYPPVANFTAQGNIACPGAAVQFSDQSSGPPSSWSWSFPGGTPSSSTQQNPVVVYNTPGTFNVTMIATNANGTDTIIRNGTVTINTSPYPAPSVTGDSICGAGIVNLSATASGGGTLRWWDAPGGGNVVNTGSTYSPNLSATTTFYVDEEFPPALDDFVGEFDKSNGQGAYFTANDIRGLYFDVLSPVLLKSVDVYSNSAGNRTIEILDAFGTLMDTTVFIPASPNSAYTVNLNFKIYPGSQYFIKCRGLVDLYRNSSGPTYPYTSSAINITGSNASAPGYYYFFYNWVFAPIQCNTPRSPVTGIVGCIGIEEDALTKGTLSVFPNPNNGLFDLSFHVKEQDDYVVKIINALGQVIYSETIINFKGDYLKKMDLSSFGKGVYMMSLTNSKNEAVKRVMVY